MNKIIELLGNQAEYYLNHTCKTIDKSLIHVPSPDTIDKIWIDSDRNIQTLRSLQTLLGHGRLATATRLPKVDATALQPPSMASFTMFSGSK